MSISAPEPLPHTLSQDILAVFENLGSEATLGDLIHSVQHKGFGFLFVILNIVPVMPASSGIATPFGILTIILAIQIWLGREEPWFPPKMLAKPVGIGLRKFLTKTAGTLQKLERRLKPRMSFMYRPAIFRFGMAPLIVACGISVAIPLPGTNSVAGLAILMIGLGMLEEDGLFGLTGMLIAAIGLTLAVLSIYFFVTYGPQGIDMLKNMIRGR